MRCESVRAVVRLYRRTEGRVGWVCEVCEVCKVTVSDEAIAGASRPLNRGGGVVMAVWVMVW